MDLQLDQSEAPECSGLPGQLVLGARVLTAGRTGAVDRGHPQVGRARVKDDGELLRGGSDADGAEVLQLPGGDSKVHGLGTLPRHPPWPLQGLSLGGRLSSLPAFPFTVLLVFLSLSYASILQDPA